MTPPVVAVAAAIIERADGAFLMACRPEGKAYAGWWEFPGGKVEAGETPDQALTRELHEELGIEVTQAWPWLNRRFEYPHAHVLLHFFRVTAWRGEPHGREGQALQWTHATAPNVEPILPANGPILKGLRLPLEYAISAASDLGERAFLGTLRTRLADGLKFVQLREKTLSPDARLRLAEAAARLCREYNARLAINGDIALAKRLEAGLHLPSAQLMRLNARPDLEWVGASCHRPDELARAAELGLDWVVLGPVRRTASHPDASPIGWDTIAAWLRDYPLPVYALGGLHTEDLGTARRSGAHGIALRSAAWRLTT